MADAIKIEGLREFSRSLKTMDRELPKALRMALNEAADVVVDDARPRVPVLSGRARRSMRSASTRTKARIRAGGRRAPHYPWLDFGGRVGPNKSVSRPFLKDGRYIYRAYYDNRDEFESALQRALIGVARQAGLEVT